MSLFCPCPGNPLFAMVFPRLFIYYNNRMVSSYRFHERKTIAKESQDIKSFNGFPQYLSNWNRIGNYIKDKVIQNWALYSMLHCQRPYVFLAYAAYLLVDYLSVCLLVRNDISNTEDLTSWELDSGYKLDGEKADCCDSNSNCYNSVSKENPLAGKFDLSKRVIFLSCAAAAMSAVATVAFYNFYLQTFVSLGKLVLFSAMSGVGVFDFLALKNRLVDLKDEKYEPIGGFSSLDHKKMGDGFKKIEGKALLYNSMCTGVSYMVGTALFGTAPGAIACLGMVAVNVVAQALASNVTLYRDQNEQMKEFIHSRGVISKA